MIRLILILLLLPTLAFGAACDPGTYYIDHDTGSDAAAGSQGAPWAHIAVNCTPVAGNTFLFKGGVRYPHEIKYEWSGSAGSPITLKGDTTGWGTGKAILDGSDALAMSACTAQGTGSTECDNANWATMFYASLPAGQDQNSVIMESDIWLTKAQIPAQASFNDDAAQWYQRDSGVGDTTTVDAAVLTQADGYYIGAWFSTHTTGNGTCSSQITASDQSDTSITYGSINTACSATADAPSVLGKYLYTITNHVHLITAAGQYAIDTTNSKVYVWPSADSNAIRISSRPRALYTNSQNYVVADGFVLQGFHNTGIHENLNGCGVSRGSTPTAGIVVKNSDFKNISNVGSCTAAAVFDGSGSDAENPNSFTDNTMRYVSGRGVFHGGNRWEIKRGTFEYITATVIYAQNVGANPVLNGTIDGNTIQNCLGTHSNGITTYGAGGQTASAITISNNKVMGFTGSVFGPYAFAAQGHKDLTIYNNIFEGAIEDANVVAGCTYQKYYNNTISQHPTSVNLFQCPGNCSGGYELKNNIIGGGEVHGTACAGALWTDMVHENNVWTAYGAGNAQVGSGWSLGATELYDTDLTHTFTDAANHDYTLVAGSIAIGVGADLSASFTTDLNGVTRTAPWDAGAYKNATSETNWAVTASTSVPCTISPASQAIADGQAATVTLTVPNGFRHGTTSNGTWTNDVVTSAAITVDTNITLGCEELRIGGVKQ